MRSKLKYRKRHYFIGVMMLLVCWWLRPIDIEQDNISYSSVIDDADGNLLSAHIAKDEQWRFPVMDTVPQKFEKAILTFEDKRFYNHIGIDALAVGRAILQNVKQRRVVSGASTITMQLARMMSDHRERSLRHKIEEMLLALRIDLWNSKRKILSKYAALAPFGGNVVGVEAACWRYFKKKPTMLSWAEAATLAVLPNSPSLIHVNRNRAQLQEKRDQLLESLHMDGSISEVELDLAKSESLPNRTFALPNDAAHFLQFEKSKGGSIPYNIQRDLQSSIKDIIEMYYSEWSQNEIYNAGIVVLDTKSGEVISYHGNIPGSSQEYAVDMVQAQRSSGSILKPLLYAAMIDEGQLSPISLVLDVPTFIDGFHPNNYNREYSGLVPADVALRRSLNVPAVRSLQRYGVPKFLRLCRSAGITTLQNNADHYGLSLILGGGEVTLWELALLYRDLGLAALGDLENFPISQAAAYATLESLRGVSRPDEEGNWTRFGSARDIAWKTGTSYGHRDAWAVGVAPEVTIAVWVGNADGEGRDGIIGTRTAGRLLFSILHQVEIEGDWFSPPYEQYAWMPVCQHSGMLATESCAHRDTMHWPQVAERSTYCTFHKDYVVSADEGLRVTSNCQDGLATESRSYFQISPDVETYYARAHPGYERVPDYDPRCQPDDDQHLMAIVYPLEDDILYLPEDFNQDHQELIAKVSHKDRDIKIYWYLDDAYLGTTEDFHSKALLPHRGKHTLTAIDQYGNQQIRRFEVN